MNPASNDDAVSAALTVQCGITCVPADSLHLGEWR